VTYKNQEVNQDNQYKIFGPQLWFLSRIFFATHYHISPIFSFNQSPEYEFIYENIFMFFAQKNAQTHSLDLRIFWLLD